MGGKQEKSEYKYVTVIGDVHGCAQTLQLLLDKIPCGKDSIIVLVGDIIDRGPNSFLAWQIVKNKNIKMIMGNHEWMFIKRTEGPEYMELWIWNGGTHTIQSFERAAKETGISTQTLLKELEITCKQLPLYMQFYFQDGKQLLITHAGISSKFQSLNEALKTPLHSELSIIWYRGELAELPDTIQVCGHTPVTNGPKKVKGGWMIDTGCVYSYPGMGMLSALIFDMSNSHAPPEIITVKRIDF